MQEVIWFLLAMVALIEFVLFLSLNKSYFSHGIRVFKRVCEDRSQLQNASIQQELMTFADGGFRSEMIFYKKFNDEEYAFRESFSDFRIKFLRYFPVMRGYIEVNKTSNTVSVEGYINWHVILIAVNLIVNRFLLSPAAALASLTLISFFIQKSRFNKIADIISFPPKTCI